VRLTRQLLEGINYEEIVNEVNADRLPGLMVRPRRRGLRGGDKVRADVKSARTAAGAERRNRGAAGRLVGSAIRPAGDRRHGLGASRTRSSRRRVACCGGSRRHPPDRDDRAFAAAVSGVRGRVVLQLSGDAPVARAGAGVRRFCTCAARSTSSTTTSCSQHKVFSLIKLPKSSSSKSKKSCTTTSSTRGCSSCAANLSPRYGQEFPTFRSRRKSWLGSRSVIMQWPRKSNRRCWCWRVMGRTVSSETELGVRRRICATCDVQRAAGAPGGSAEDIPWNEEDGSQGSWAPDARCGFCGYRPSRRGSAARGRGVLLENSR